MDGLAQAAQDLADEAMARTQAINTAVAAEAQARGTAISELKTEFQDQDTALAQDITALGASLNNRLDFSPLRTHHFESSLEGWATNTDSGASISFHPSGYIQIKRGNSASYAYRNLSITERFDGSQYPIIRARIRKTHTLAGKANFYFSTLAGAVNETRKKVFSYTESTDWQVLELDMREVADWDSSPITQIRFDQFGTTTLGQSFDIDWVSIGSNTPGSSTEQINATAAAVQVLETRVTSIENVNTAQASQITNLQSDIAGKANAAAVQALETRVTTAENLNTAQSTSITGLTAGQANGNGDNWIANPKFLAEGALPWVTNVTATSMEIFNRTDAGVPAACPVARVACATKKNTDDNWAGIGLRTINAPASNSPRIPTTGGELVDVSVWMYVQSAGALVGRFVLTQCDTSGQGFVNTRVVSYVNATGGWQKLTGTLTAHVNAVEISPVIIFEAAYAAAGDKLWFGEPSVTKRSAEGLLQASVNQSLQAQVTTNKNNLTSQSSSITSLQNQVNSKASTAAVQALENRVTTTEGQTTANSTAITNVNATLNANNPILIADAGCEDIATGWVLQTNVDNPILDGGFGLRQMRFLNTTASTYVRNKLWFNVQPGEQIRFTWYTRTGGTPADLNSTATVRFGVSTKDATDTGVNVNTFILSHALVGHARTKRTAIWTVPATVVKARLFVACSGGVAAGTNYAALYFDDISAERIGTDVQQNAAATQSLEARASTLENGQSTLFAQYVLSVDVNGRVGGMKLANNGKQVSLTFVTDSVKFLAVNANSGTDIENGIIRTRKGNYQRVIGPGFGVNSDLMDWYGPAIATNQCSKANATMWMDINGNAYWGGSLSAGVRHNAAQSTTIGSNSEVTVGPFGTAGKPKQIVVSYDFNSSATTTASQGNGVSGSATVRLYRSIGGAAETLLATWTVSGGISSIYMGAEPGGLNWYITQTFTGSWTYTDNTTSTVNYSYRVAMSGRTGWSAPNPNGTKQTLAVSSTEQ